MTTPLIVIAAVAGVGLFYVVVPMVLDAYRRYMGIHLVTCPETRQGAKVEVNAGQAALLEAIGRHEPRVRHCSRWPERHDCGQECVRQL
jgi:hypothetical protein